MRASQKVDYALRAMLELAAMTGGRRLRRSAEVAAKAHVPERYLESIMADLGRAGLLHSRRGPEGGHELARPAAKVTVAAIHQAVAGALDLGGEARGVGKPPQDGVDAALRGFWRDVERAVRDAMQRVTLEDLRRRADSRRDVNDFAI